MDIRKSSISKGNFKSTQKNDEVRKEEYASTDFYYGSSAALIKAGIVEEHMLPGRPGRNKTSVTFRGQGPMQIKSIKRTGANRFEVRKTISTEEKNRREAAQQNEERKTQEASLDDARKYADFFSEKMLERDHISHVGDAKFQVGDVCLVFDPGYETDGEAVEITGEYKLREVLSKYGRYSDGGEKFDYIFGYLARLLGEKAYFYPAHKLRNLDYTVRHLRLVDTPKPNGYQPKPKKAA